MPARYRCGVSTPCPRILLLSMVECSFLLLSKSEKTVTDKTRLCVAPNIAENVQCLVYKAPTVVVCWFSGQKRMRAKQPGVCRWVFGFFFIETS